MLVDRWELVRIEDIPNHKMKRYVFRSYDITMVDGYEAKRCVQIHIGYDKDDTIAWRNLSEYLKRKEKENNR